METIKVNMSPNPLDVQTIHASQNDGEARLWEFELHNNGELIDTSEVTEQMFFKSYKGGTEQILPENGAVPVTAPFVGDIKYPDATRTDQEFLYRQSPTEKDGNAKITDIKGNTLVWNQQVGTNVNGLNTTQGTTFTRNPNGSIHVTGTGTGNHFCEWRTVENPSFIMSKGHKYLVKFKGLTTGIVAQVSVSAGQTIYLVNKVNFVGDYDEIFTPTQDGITGSLVRFYATNTFSGTTDVIMQLFDLTQMGLDSLTVEKFTSLFPKPYYAYNQGTLLSFMGSGIKTVGKNQVANVVKGYFNNQSSTITINNGGESVVFYAWTGKTYYASSSIALNRNVIAQCDTPNLVNGSPIYNPVNFGNETEKKWTATWTGWTVWYVYNVSNDNVHNSAQVEIGTTATDFEPYTSSTLSLPISTYFPNGMKSAGSVYDELTPRKAITRIGAVDLGSLTWSYASDAGHLRFVSSTISPEAKLPADNTIANAVCTKYEIVTEGNVYNNQKIGLCVISNSRVMVCDLNYTDATAFKTAMDGVYLYYELATETETPITTASLVTENAEIPLSNEDGVLLGKCTEQLSENPGFIDAKIKLSDADGECYSNKIQLHIERSPQ